MEDPSEECWEIENYSQLYGRKSKLGWIWKKGLSIGKNIMMTGVVMSSAPVVLPPLVAISAFGFVFTLPAGFAFVTYACTEKLVNCLLPLPSPPPLLDDGKLCFNEEEYWSRDDVKRRYEDIQVTEKEFGEGTINGVEMRIELVKEDDKDSEPDDYDKIPINKLEKDREAEVNEIVKEQGYEEDDAVYEEQPLNSNAIPEILKGISEAEGEIESMKEVGDEMQLDSIKAVVLAAEVGGDDENTVEQVLQELALVGSPKVKEQNGHTENFNSINEEEMRRGTAGLIEEMRDESNDYQRKQENEEEISIKDMNETKGNCNLFVILEEAKPVEDDKGVISCPRSDDTSNDASSAGTGKIDQEIIERKPDRDKSASLQEEPKVVQEKLVGHVKTCGGHTTTDAHQGRDSGPKRRTLVLSNDAAREMADESGFDLFDHETHQITKSIDEGSEGEEASPENVIYANIGNYEVLIESEVPVPKSTKVALDKDTKAASDKVSPTEQKIWEQIHALQTIVGYTDTSHSSCVEELKALFVFTGVEPPASFKDPAELLDVHEKLRFLMAIVGVK